MTRNPVKARLLAGEVARGLWLNLETPVAAEIAAQAGFDWGLIDCEHGVFDPAGVRTRLMALAQAGAEGVVRLPGAQPWMIQQVLDAGARGIMVPRVEAAGTAAAIVAAGRYPPAGSRGMAAAITRGGGYGGDPLHRAQAADDMLVALQIETRAGLDAIEAIAAVDGVDVLFVGPADLAMDLGLDMGAPAHAAILSEALDRIAAAGAIPGILAFGPAEAASLRAAGARMLGVGSDVALLAGAMRQLEEATR